MTSIKELSEKIWGKIIEIQKKERNELKFVSEKEYENREKKLDKLLKKK